jgi:hypothetical protein
LIFEQVKRTKPLPGDRTQGSGPKISQVVTSQIQYAQPVDASGFSEPFCAEASQAVRLEVQFLQACWQEAEQFPPCRAKSGAPDFKAA